MLNEVSGRLTEPARAPTETTGRLPEVTTAAPGTSAGPHVATPQPREATGSANRRSHALSLP
jgi:hypothetical protein